MKRLLQPALAAHIPMLLSRQLLAASLPSLPSLPLPARSIPGDGGVGDGADPGQQIKPTSAESSALNGAIQAC